MNSPIFQIRKFKESDQAEVRRLYRQNVATNPDHYYRPLSGPQLPDDVAGNFSHSNDAFYVATVQDKIAGFCGLRTFPEDRSTASCMNGMVVPEFQKLGIYKAMFQIREAEAVRKGLHTLFAITSEKNAKMLSFLQRNGFEIYVAENPIKGFVNLRKRLLP